MTDEQFADLEKRVRQFERMELPGQPLGMHMGTYHLLADLWRSFVEARDRLAGVPETHVIVKKGFIHASKCGIEGCVGKGWYADHGEQIQCQWCAEHRAMLAQSAEQPR